MLFKYAKLNKALHKHDVWKRRKRHLVRLFFLVLTFSLYEFSLSIFLSTKLLVLEVLICLTIAVYTLCVPLYALHDWLFVVMNKLFEETLFLHCTLRVIFVLPHCMLMIVKCVCMYKKECLSRRMLQPVVDVYCV